jgi:hypothetical protein
MEHSESIVKTNQRLTCAQLRLMLTENLIFSLILTILKNSC